MTQPVASAVALIARSFPEVTETPMGRMRGVVVASYVLSGVFFGLIGTWSATAPLESAAIAGGAVESETSRKTIDHLEGGIVAAILVREGDEVAAGQTLIRLDDTKARAALHQVLGQLWDARAAEARLIAEREGAERFVVPAELQLAAKDDAVVAATIAGEVKIFESRRQTAASRVDVIRKTIAQIEKRILGLRAQVRAAEGRAAIVGRELGNLRPLAERGIVTRQRIYQLEREQAEMQGQLGNLAAQIQQAEQSIGESQAQILKLESERQNEVAQGLGEARTKIFQLGERLQAARDVLARTEVKAPQAGTVTDLRVHTPGGTIAPGQPLLELVPKQDRLIVRVQVRPDDIDLVRPGLPAQVRLLPYKQRRVPPVDGVVRFVSPDRLIDKRNGEQPYYAVKIQIDEEMLKRLDGVEVLPGMPVEAFIKTGKSTVLLYAFSPLFDSFGRAFRDN